MVVLRASGGREPLLEVDRRAELREVPPALVSLRPARHGFPCRRHRDVGIGDGCEGREQRRQQRRASVVGNDLVGGPVDMQNRDLVSPGTLRGVVPLGTREGRDCRDARTLAREPVGHEPAGRVGDDEDALFVDAVGPCHHVDDGVDVADVVDRRAADRSGERTCPHLSSRFAKNRSARIDSGSAGARLAHRGEGAGRHA